jgi:hypothetical protein
MPLPTTYLFAWAPFMFAAIAAALKEMGYRGTVGLEAYASGDDKVALERFSAVFGAGTLAQQ